MSRSVYRYEKSQANDVVVTKLRELAKKHPRYGSPRLRVLLLKEGFRVNHKRVSRLLRLEGLTLKRAKKRKKIVRDFVVAISEKPNAVWGMDFVHDKLADGAKLRCLTIVDHFTRVCPGIFVQRTIKSEDLINFLEALKLKTKMPETFNLDNGSEFISEKFKRWCEENRIRINFIQPGQPTQNAFIESFNGRFRDECLNQRQFRDMTQARQMIEAWRLDYNHKRPHSSLGYRPPAEAH